MRTDDLDALFNFRFGLGRLDAAVVSAAKHDLIGANLQMAGRAARYFFFDGTGVDEDNPHTFTALCQRNKIDPDRAAKAIWNSLPEDKQREIRYLLEVKASASTI